MSSKKIYKKKKVIIPLVILLLLIAFRLYLPTLVKNNLNRTLSEIPGYYGEVEDVDIALYRGAYGINGLYLNKVEAETQIPFLNFPEIDISVQWSALFQGKIVSEIYLLRPKVNYVQTDQKKEPASSTDEPKGEDWTKAITEIVPLSINHFEIKGGEIAYLQPKADPKIDLNFSNIYFTLNNLRNVKEKNRILPSPFKMSAVAIGDGEVSMDGKINILKEIPDLDLNFSLRNTQIAALNNFTSKYAGIDFKSGLFSLYSEMAISDGNLKGYVKPLIKNSELIGNDDSFLETLWEGFVGFFKFILKNQRTDTLATKVPFEGNLNDVKTGIWPTISNTVKNAWIKAFQNMPDNTIQYSDAFEENWNADNSQKNNDKSN